jgi:preprotein translocase subunit SecE
MSINSQTDKPDTDDANDETAEELGAEADAIAADEEASEADKPSFSVERWVQLSFIAAGLMFVWLYDHLIAAIWYLFTDPDETIVTVAAIAAAAVTTVVLSKQPVIRSTVHDIVDELSKVSWPSRQETSSSTVIVVVTSVVAAIMLFLFDSVWSAVTDLVYKV